MGVLDDVMGGLGKDAGGGIADLLKGQGGVGGLVEKFGQSGLGDAAGSWIGTGPNLNVSPEQISQVLGSGPIADFACKLGVRPSRPARPSRACSPRRSTG